MNFLIDRKYSYLTLYYSWNDNSNGYMKAMIRYKKVYLHRLIMELELGRKLNKEEIVDHINHDKLDNRLINLRLVDRQLNGLNRANSEAGVSKHRHEWRARINLKGKQIYLGIYPSKDVALKAVRQKRKELLQNITK